MTQTETFPDGQQSQGARSADRPFRLAVDVGGTFTDLILMEEGKRDARLEKVPTTPDDVTRGVIGVIEKAGVDVSQISFFLHGTTIGLNAFLQRRGALTGLITTEGFRDVLEIARTDRPNMYDMLYAKPPVLVPRYLRMEVTARMNGRGEVLTPVDRASVERAVETFKREGAKAIAVCLLHAYANPAHEAEVAKIVEELYPEARVSASHTISQEYYEYERSVSTVVNASIEHLMTQYITDLEDRLDGGGFGGKFLVLRSSGGAMLPDEVKRTPVHTLLSGPSGGVMGAARLSSAAGSDNLITADAGGTSLDVSLVLDGEPVRQSHTVLNDYKLLLPVLDIRSIGAGGGSIAWLDAGNALQVGPQSAGAVPGPICYGNGGIEPTVTDAAVILGYIDAENFLGGQIGLDRAAAEKGIADRIAAPLGISVSDAACGIMAIANTRMSGIIRAITVERGHDPRTFTLVGFGGAGPLFAAPISTEIRALQTLIPKFPGSFSAWGMLATDLAYDLARTQLQPLDETTGDTVGAIFEELEAEARRSLDRDGVARSQQFLLRSVDARYWAQGHFITMPVDAAEFNGNLQENLEERFHKLHERVYGHQLDEPVVLATFRVRGVGRMPKVPVPEIPAREPGSKLEPRATRRAAYFVTRTTHEWAVYDRNDLCAGDEFAGPAVIEEGTSVSIVPPDHGVQVDSFGNILIRRAS